MLTKDSPGDSPGTVPPGRTVPTGRAARRGRLAMRVAAVVLVTTILLGVVASLAAGPDPLAAGPDPLAAGPDRQAGSEHGRLTAPQRWVLDRMPRTG